MIGIKSWVNEYSTIQFSIKSRKGKISIGESNIIAKLFVFLGGDIKLDSLH